MPRVQDWTTILQPEPPEERAGFPQAQRSIISSPLDFTVRTIVEEVTQTPPRIFVDTFQRAYIWTNAKASRLIESLLLNIPIPVCYFSEEPDGRLSIIDGNQRITSLKRFLKNEFALSGLEAAPELNRKRFHHLPPSLQNHIATRAIRCIVVDKRSDPIVKFDVFERLNTAAVALNDQELRNCLERGRLNALLHELSALQPWLQLVGRSAPDKRMRDAELILRFLALSNNLANYERPLKDFLTSFMRQHKEADAASIDRFRAQFTEAVGCWTDLLGPGVAFRRLDADGTPQGRFTAAIYDAQMVGLARAQRTHRARNEVLQFTIASTADDAPFMQRVITGSSHVDAMHWRIRHYEEFLRGQ